MGMFEDHLMNTELNNMRQTRECIDVNKHSPKKTYVGEVMVT